MIMLVCKRISAGGYIKVKLTSSLKESLKYNEIENIT